MSYPQELNQFLGAHAEMHSWENFYVYRNFENYLNF